ncbi:MAG: SGNH/GDSL hydrolase family protein [Gemmatimonadales bacterium]|nr:SGNH/GDSL hydrolase family protein [Gemmatimonadales bacterium]
MTGSRGWFERHPALTLAFVAGVGVLLLLLAAEFVLGRLDPADRGLLGAAPPGRVMTFREYPLGKRLRTRPAKASYVYPGGLEDRDYWIEIDSNGFLVPSRVHDRADLDVVFLGGSTTESMFVTPEVRFPYLVGRMLEDSLGVRVNSWNGGRSGNLVLHGVLAFVGKVAPMRPRYVVLMENVNDLAAFHHLGSYWATGSTRPILLPPSDENPASAGPVRRVKNATRALFPHLYIALDRTTRALWRGPVDEFAATRGKPSAWDSVHAETSYRRSLESFVALARTWGSTPVLMTQASRFSATPDPEVVADWSPSLQAVTFDQFRLRHARFNDIVREVAAAMAVPLVDLERLVATNRSVMYDAVHYTDAGSRLVAPLIARELLAQERRRAAATP